MDNNELYDWFPPIPDIKSDATDTARRKWAMDMEENFPQPPMRRYVRGEKLNNIYSDVCAITDEIMSKSKKLFDACDYLKFRRTNFNVDMPLEERFMYDMKFYDEMLEEMEEFITEMNILKKSERFERIRKWRSSSHWKEVLNSIKDRLDFLRMK